MSTSTREVTSVAPGVSFRDLFEANFTHVCRALRRLGVHPGDLEDVAQELFVTVHRALPDYDPSRAARPWLLSFALRFAANYRRLARTRGHVSDDAIAEVATPGSDAEARDLVLRALDTLDFDRRSLIVMHDLEGWSAPEIATELGVPLNTAYSRLRVARADFERKVRELADKGGAE